MEELGQNTTHNMTVDNSNAVLQPPQTLIAPLNVVYAGFWSRYFAMVIDTLIVWTPLVVLIFILVFANLWDSIGDNPMSTLMSVIALIIQATYNVYFISRSGQTPGKKILKIKVQEVSTGKNLGIVAVVLREVIGKFISSFFDLGYIWMLRDPNKQTWHDKIAKSVVVKVK